MKYKWCEKSGVIDENGRQVQQLLLTTTKKMRRECGKVLVDFLNAKNADKLQRAKQMSVVDIDDFRPHLVIQTHDKKVHVVPVGVVMQWANGEEKPDEDCLRKIISEWLEHVTGEQNR